MRDPFYDLLRHNTPEPPSPDAICVIRIRFWSTGGGAQCGANVFWIEKAAVRQLISFPPQPRTADANASSSRGICRPAG